jgi:hypothetical protein
MRVFMFDSNKIGPYVPDLNAASQQFEFHHSRNFDEVKFLFCASGAPSCASVPCQQGVARFLPKQRDI